MNITINGRQCEAEHGEFILDVAVRNGIQIPALCHSEALPGLSSCRLCIVEVIENNWSKVVASCVYPVTSEIEVLTDSEKIKRMRKTLLMLLGARAPQNAYVRKLLAEYEVTPAARFQEDPDENCIMCGLCVSACDKIGAGAISTVYRGIAKKVSTPYDESSETCIGCSACASVCPTGAIKVQESNGKRTIWKKEFELLPCAVCGKPFITPEQIAYVKAKSNQEMDEILCETCKKKSSGERLAQICADLTPSKGLVR